MTPLASFPHCHPLVEPLHTRICPLDEQSLRERAIPEALSHPVEVTDPYLLLKVVQSAAERYPAVPEVAWLIPKTPVVEL